MVYVLLPIALLSSSWQIVQQPCSKSQAFRRLNMRITPGGIHEAVTIYKVLGFHHESKICGCILTLCQGSEIQPRVEVTSKRREPHFP